MRSLPASLLAKIFKAQQTIHNNADPKMHLILQRMHRYIERGALMDPTTVMDESGAGSWDLDMRRPDHLKAPDKLYKIYVVSGQAHVARTDYVDALDVLTSPENDQIQWEYLYAIGGTDTVDACLEFDGIWMPASKEAEICFDSPARWTMLTVGEPWLFWVNSSGELWAQQGDDITTLNQLSTTGVTKVASVRGWKSVVDATSDQGLIVGYIQNGEIKYRNYCEQSDTTRIWESSKTVTTFDTTTHPAVNLAVFRTNDFRSGFMAEINGEIYMAITTRNWSGMSVGAELIMASITDFDLELIPIMHTVVGDGPYPTDDKRHWLALDRWGEFNNELISTSITDFATMFLWGVATIPILAENIPVTDTVTGEAVGTGDDVQMVFELVYEPDAESETIYVDGVAKTRGVDYTVAGTEITFALPPAGGLAITADYTWQNWGKRIRITFDHGITNVTGQHTNLTVQDEVPAFYHLSVTAEGVKHNDPTPLGRFDGTRELIAVVSDFNNAVGDLMVTFTAGAGRLQGEAGQDLDGFTISFTPVNLLADDTPAPELEAIWNE